MASGLRPDQAYLLPDDLRPAFSEPWGPVVDTDALRLMLRDDDVVLAVGDVVSTTLQDIGITPKLFVCDYHTQRGHDEELQARLGDWGDQEIRVDNPAASITAAAWDAVTTALATNGTTRIVVDGEEDLLGLPCFLEAPEGAIVLYGMPKRGVVVCHVDAGLQARIRRLVEAMHPA